MLRKKISKTFKIPEFDATVELSAYLHNVSYSCMQSKKRKSLDFLNKLSKNDRAVMYDVSKSGIISDAIINIDDVDALIKAFKDSAENVRMCVRDTLEMIVTDQEGNKETYLNEQAWDNAESPLNDEMVKWLESECTKAYPELFSTAVHEKKKSS